MLGRQPDAPVGRAHQAVHDRGRLDPVARAAAAGRVVAVARELHRVDAREADVPGAAPQAHPDRVAVGDLRDPHVGDVAARARRPGAHRHVAAAAAGASATAARPVRTGASATGTRPEHRDRVATSPVPPRRPRRTAEERGRVQAPLAPRRYTARMGAWSCLAAGAVRMSAPQAPSRSPARRSRAGAPGRGGPASRGRAVLAAGSLGCSSPAAWPWPVRRHDPRLPRPRRRARGADLDRRSAPGARPPWRLRRGRDRAGGDVGRVRRRARLGPGDPGPVGAGRDRRPARRLPAGPARPVDRRLRVRRLRPPRRGARARPVRGRAGVRAARRRVPTPGCTGATPTRSTDRCSSSRPCRSATSTRRGALGPSRRRRGRRPGVHGPRLASGAARWVAIRRGPSPSSPSTRSCSVWTVGGAHNDLLMLLALLAGVALVVARARPRARRRSWRRSRSRPAPGWPCPSSCWAPGAAVGRRPAPRSPRSRSLVLAVLAFPGHAAVPLDVLRHEQRLVAFDSVPAELARHAGLPA